MNFGLNLKFLLESFLSLNSNSKFKSSFIAFILVLSSFSSLIYLINLIIISL